MGATSFGSSYRRWESATKVLAAVLLVAAVSGCASTPPIGYQGKPFQPEPDERLLWTQAEKEEERLSKSGRIYADPVLETYLSAVAAKLLPSEARAAGAPPLRVVVLKDPAVNAFAMPNGAIYLHTGLFARIENEAQLAAVLGREITHVTHRHTLRLARHERTLAGGLSAAAGPLPAPAVPQSLPGFVGLDLPLARLAAVDGFGQNLEREADFEGMDRMVAAGYDPREAPRLFARLREDHGGAERLEPFFLGNPARLDARIAATRAWIMRHEASPAAERLVRNPEDWARQTRVLVRENALLDIRAGRFDRAGAQLDRVLALAPDDAVARLHYGDLYRIRAQRAEQPADARALSALARAEYERAATLDPSSADPYRQLGLLHYQDKDFARAREAFQRYLAIRPDAPDARRIKEYLGELSR